MREMNRIVSTLCRSPRIPLSLRRRVGRLFVPFSGEPFSIDIDGRPYRGKLDNTIEWVAFVTGQFYEYTYLNLIRSFRLEGCAVDVGGNVGNHAFALAGMFAEVISVEPFPPLFERLQAKTMDLPGVQPYNVAFGSDDGTLAFDPPRGRNLGTGRLHESGVARVAVVRGDTFLHGRHRLEIGLIKVDVEGHEAEVLRGLSETLRRARPLVLYEAPRAFRKKGGASLADSFRLFPEGYSFWGLRGQTTFPIQRDVARPIRLGPRNQTRRFSYVIAAPDEREFPGLEGRE